MTATKPGPATPGVFELDDETARYVDTYGTIRNTGKPPRYLDAMREAVQTGARKGLSLPSGEDKHNRKARSDLARAAQVLARELNLTGEYIAVTARLVRDHPKHGTFMAWSAERKPVENSQ